MRSVLMAYARFARAVVDTHRTVGIDDAEAILADPAVAPHAEDMVRQAVIFAGLHDQGRRMSPPPRGHEPSPRPMVWLPQAELRRREAAGPDGVA